MIDKNNKTVILDIDDTLCDLKTSMCEHLCNYSNKDIHWKSWHTFDIVDLYGMTIDEFNNVLISNKILENCVPYDETKSFISTLKKKGYNVVIVSSRGYHPRAYEMTKEWFAKYDLEYDEIHIVNHGMSKIEVVKDYNIVLAIDDSEKNCNDFFESGKVKHTLVMDMPWNKNSEITRIYNLNEALKYI